MLAEVNVLNTKFTDKKRFTQQVKIHKIWRRISVFFVFAGKHLRKCFSVFLWVLCSFLTISVYDAKIRQIPTIAKNHPTVTCKNLLTKPLFSLKDVNNIFLPCKPYFSVQETIS